MDAPKSRNNKVVTSSSPNRLVLSNYSPRIKESQNAPISSLSTTLNADKLTSIDTKKYRPRSTAGGGFRMSAKSRA